jgi:lipoprotein NlpD
MVVVWELLVNAIRCLIPLFLSLGLLAGCAGPPPAPVEDRSSRSQGESLKPNAHYKVKRGDSLHAIAFKFGLDWREIARLNSIPSPYVIHPDQVLRLTSSGRNSSKPAKLPASGSSSKVKTSGASTPSGATTRSIETPRSSSTTSQPQAKPPAKTPSTEQKPVAVTKAQPAKTTVTGTKAPAGSTYSTPAGDPDRWLWPAEGKLVSTFRANDPARKGIDIGNKAGQAVVASAAGQVVYSGSGLIGYGELIIIKHSDRMLSAYAHNRIRLVSEGQQVTAGSQIAEMGTNDRNQAVLHFEIRVNGITEDPVKYFPGR